MTRATTESTITDREVKLATTDLELLDCFTVMNELRPHLSKNEFIARVRRQQASGYQLAFCCDGDNPVCVTGFRVGENLAWGRYLYVDDLVTATAYRSKGYGTTLMDWLKEYAANNQCEQLHLDSGAQRKDAHRFYERENMSVTGYHFVYFPGAK